MADKKNNEPPSLFDLFTLPVEPPSGGSTEEGTGTREEGTGNREQETDDDRPTDGGTGNGKRGTEENGSTVQRSNGSTPPIAPSAGGGGATGGSGPLHELIDDNFLQFASYTICNRAIPTVEDGLKPVQRRIMHALWEADDGRFTKVAGIVGDTMHYHPHGDASIYEAVVNLVNMRYLVEGQGNYGNLFTGDPAAAPRYIECRLTELARKEVFNPKITSYIPSYDGRGKEPVLLPSKLPLLLLMGAKGIAVGLSTEIFPHNFNELIEAQLPISSDLAGPGRSEEKPPAGQYPRKWSA